MDDVWLTVGRFNSPVGLEARDTVDRRLVSASLLFPARPTDVTGASLSLPLPQGITISPFIANGFLSQEWDNNTTKSVGVNLSFAHKDIVAASVAGWFGSELANNEGDQLWLVDGHLTLRPTELVLLAGEFLWARSDIPPLHFNLNLAPYFTKTDDGVIGWWGFQVMAGLDYRWLELTAAFSQLDEEDGSARDLWQYTPAWQQVRRKISACLGLRPHEHARIRLEYTLVLSDLDEIVRDYSPDDIEMGPNPDDGRHLLWLQFLISF